MLKIEEVCKVIDKLIGCEYFSVREFYFMFIIVIEIFVFFYLVKYVVVKGKVEKGKNL